MTLDGHHLIDIFDAKIAPYAQYNANSRGRIHKESVDPERLGFQRDRDRIIFSPAFRRLQGKTQVVSPQFGDHFRNRLTHTIEVAQIARDLARQLKLNEDLAEAIALAHDLGHPPFGHSGERALDEKMQERGLHFDHNIQSLRVVTVFEKRYPHFPGLNLTHEVLEGIQKHETFFDRPHGPIYTPHLESQLVDISDEIAYLSADLEDGLRGKFFTREELLQQTIPKLAHNSLPPAEHTNRSSLIRRIIRHLLEHIVRDTQNHIHQQNIRTLEDVQQSKIKIVSFEADFFRHFRDLKQFLFKRYYGAPKVQKLNDQGKAIIYQIFDDLLQNPDQIPSKAYDNFPDESLESKICDYIAGMTDQFAHEFVHHLPS